MKQQIEVTYPLPLAKWKEMFADESFHHFRFPKELATLTKVNISAAENTLTATVKLLISRQNLPSAAAAFVKQDVQMELTRQVVFDCATTAHAHEESQVLGLPLRYQSDWQIISEGECCRAQVAAQVSVNIPFLGARAEQKIMPYLEKIILEEPSACRKWQKENSR